MKSTTPQDRLIGSLLTFSRECRYDGGDMHCFMAAAINNTDDADVEAVVRFLDAARERATAFREVSA